MLAKPQKILYVITKSNWGGAQRYVYDLATTLPPENFEVVVALGGTGETDAPAGGLEERLRSAGIRTIFIPDLTRDVSFVRDWLVLTALVKILKTERPDIIHLNSSKAGGVGALAGRIAGVPKIIFTVHGWAFNEDRSLLAKIIIKKLSWFTVLLSHQTIVLNQSDYKDLSNWPLVKNKIKLIRNGLRDWPADDRVLAKNKLSQTFSVGQSGYLIGTIAELHKNKGLNYLIEALEQLPKTVSLCIIGVGEEKENLLSLVNQLGLSQRVFFTGFIANAANLIKAFDIFVLPSIKEGLPFVLLEAGARSVPIIAARVGGIPEIIEDKETGLLVEPRRSNELAAAIKFLMDHPEEKERHAKALATKIKTEFNFETTTLPQTLALYR